VRSNDVVFSIHANAATALTLVQICVYQRGDQGVSRWMWAALAASGVAVAGYAAALAAGARAFSVLGLLYLLSYIKLAGSAVKYIPQIALQRANASTEGFTIANALTDLGGGVLSMAQQARRRTRAARPAPGSLGAAQRRAAAVRAQVLDAVALRDASLVTGNPVKLGLGLISIAYCIVLAVQHYCTTAAAAALAIPAAAVGRAGVTAPVTYCVHLSQANIHLAQARPDSGPPEQARFLVQALRNSPK